MAAPSNTVWGTIATGSTSTKKGRLGISTTVSSSNTTTSVTVQVWYWSMYMIEDVNNNFYYNTASTATTRIGSVSIYNSVNSGSGWSTSNQCKIAEYSYSYTRTTSASTKYYAAKLTGLETLGTSNAVTVSTSITVPALTSYTVSYNANGGSGAPSSQTKWYGTNITLSSTKPSRTGYSFQGWATSSTGGVSYSSGATYSSNASVTLYAVWKANTYTVTFNANGGSGAPANQTKTYGVTLTLSSTIPTRTNYNFLGWATSSTAASATYEAGGTYTGNTAITLYAVWELAYIKPRIYNLTATRCLSDGTADEEGLYGLIHCDWETDKDDTSIKIEYKLTSETDWTTASELSPGGTSGTVNIIIGGSLSADNVYDIRVTVIDSVDHTPSSTILPGTKYVIDILAEGKGLAFGKPAELENTLDVEFEAKFNKPVYGKVLGMDELPAIPDDSDLNNYIDTGCYSVRTTVTARTVTNIPVQIAGRLEVWDATGSTIGTSDWTYLRQRYVPFEYGYPTWERTISRDTTNAWTYSDWWRSNLTASLSKQLYEGSNKILAANINMYMTASHTVTLSEAISSQHTGIVLVWAQWNSTESRIVNHYSYTFIPKYAALYKPGNFVWTGFPLWSSSDSHLIKGLWVDDTTLRGHEINDGSTNSSSSNLMVLHAVIGI